MKKRKWTAEIIEDQTNPHLPFRAEVTGADGERINAANLFRTYADAAEHVKHGLIFIMGCDGAGR